MTRTIIHIDMDAFYAAVEQRDNPSLRNRPVIVGGHPKRGVVLAASYEVRPYGVRSAMPMRQALQAAPHAVVVSPRFDAYLAASNAVFRIFGNYTPLIEPLSLDEAFLDVTESLSLFGKGWEIATAIRLRIRKEVGLPSSAGISHVKFIAKIASDLAKPDGQKEVSPCAARAFLAPLPVSRLWGVGRKTEMQFNKHGLQTIGDVASKELRWLSGKLGNSAKHFLDLSHGVDNRVVTIDRKAKSISAQDTFEADLSGEEALKPHLHAQALRVAQRLRHAKLKAQIVQLSIKYDDFTLVTKQSKVILPTDDGQVLYRAALALLLQLKVRRRIRLTGICAQELSNAAQQLSLFNKKPNKHDRLNQTLDRISSKFGLKALTTADLFTKVSKRKFRS